MHESVNSMHLKTEETYQDFVVNLKHLFRRPIIEMKFIEDEDALYKEKLKDVFSYLNSSKKQYSPVQQLFYIVYSTMKKPSSFIFDEYKIDINGRILPPKDMPLLYDLFVNKYAEKSYNNMLKTNNRIKEYVDKFVEKSLEIINKNNKEQFLTMINKFPLLIGNRIKAVVKNKHLINNDTQLYKLGIKCIGVFEGHKAGIKSLLKFNDTIIASSSKDDTIKIWSLNSSNFIELFKRYNNPNYVQGLDRINKVIDFVDDFSSRDIKKTIQSQYKKSLDALNNQFGFNKSIADCLGTLKGHTSHVTSVLKFDDNTLVSCSDDSTIKIWDITGLTLKGTLEGHDDDIRAIIKFDDNTLISCSDDQTIKVWNMDSLSLRGTLSGHTSDVTSVLKFDENTLVSGSNETIKVWNIEHLCLKGTLEGHQCDIMSVIKFNKNYIVSCSFDKTIKVWDMKNLTLKSTFLGHAQIVNLLLKFNKNILISGSRDNTIKIWNMKDLSLKGTLVGHQGWIKSFLKFDEKILISCSNDNTIKIWDIDNFSLIDTQKGHKNSLLIKFNENTIISASNKKIEVWGLPSFEQALDYYMSRNRLIDIHRNLGNLLNNLN